MVAEDRRINSWEETTKMNQLPLRDYVACWKIFARLLILKPFDVKMDLWVEIYDVVWELCVHFDAFLSHNLYLNLGWSRFTLNSINVPYLQNNLNHVFPKIFSLKSIDKSKRENRIAFLPINFSAISRTQIRFSRTLKSTQISFLLRAC